MPNLEYLGQADDVKQISSCTVTTGWATGDTAVTEINNRQVIVTIGTAVTPADVAAAMAAAINASNTTSGLVGDETINIGGQEIGEFRDVVASASGDVLTLTSSTAGWDFTATVSETTAGAGTMGTMSTSQNATGKNWFNNADNWNGTITQGDTLHFRNPVSDITHGLGNSVADLSIIKANSFRKNIGLPEINKRHGAAYAYKEYRTSELALPITSSTGDQTIQIGDVDSSVATAGICRLNLGTNVGNSQTLIMRNAPASTTETPYAVTLTGGNKIDLYLFKGSFEVGTSSAHTASIVGDVFIGSIGNVENDVTAHFGAFGSMNVSGSTFNQHGGIIRFDTTSNVNNTDFYIKKGIMYAQRGSGAGTAWQSLRIYPEGMVYYDAATITALHLDGVLRADEGRGFTVTNTTLYPSYKLINNTNNITFSNTPTVSFSELS